MKYVGSWLKDPMLHVIVAGAALTAVFLPSGALPGWKPRHASHRHQAGCHACRLSSPLSSREARDLALLRAGYIEPPADGD